MGVWWPGVTVIATVQNFDCAAVVIGNCDNCAGGFVQLDAWVGRGIPACAWDVLQLQVMDWTFALCRRRRVAQFLF